MADASGNPAGMLLSLDIYGIYLTISETIKASSIETIGSSVPTTLISPVRIDHFDSSLVCCGCRWLLQWPSPGVRSAASAGRGSAAGTAAGNRWRTGQRCAGATAAATAGCWRTGPQPHSCPWRSWCVSYRSELFPVTLTPSYSLGLFFSFLFLENPV